jgi:hypothetical protein
VKSAPAILGVVALCLAIVWTAVFVLGDTRILVSPPEAVAEQFFRSLQTRRYEQGRAQLAPDLRAKTTADDLRRLHDDLETRVGRIENVEAEKAAALDSAHCLLETERGRARVTLPFERTKGEWHIRDLDGLQRVPAPDARQLASNESRNGQSKP